MTLTQVAQIIGEVATIAAAVAAVLHSIGTRRQLRQHVGRFAPAPPTHDHSR